MIEQPATEVALAAILPELSSVTALGSTIFELESVHRRGHPPLRLHLLHELLLI